MFGSLDISTSGLIAQRTRMNVVAGNLANQFTVTDPQGNAAPYQRRMPVFVVGDPTSGNPNGVHVQDILKSNTFKLVYEPGSDFADENGYVNYPDISPAMEMVDAMEATRAYEANISAIEATKAI